MQTTPQTDKKISFDDFKKQVISDYRLAVTSRECSLLGRREVLTGKAKFGIFGDGKEVPQIAWAKAFKRGDWRSGYYRDQTFMMALGELNTQQLFAGLYGHPDIVHDPMSAGRQMGGHFGTHSLDENYRWKDLTAQYNSSPDVSPTASQMPRLLGLAQASKVFRENKGLKDHISTGSKTTFSVDGNEVAWGTIGNASASEGLFWETVNAGGVLQVPMVISIWDDEYGISVHAKHQTTKEDLSEILSGFQRTGNAPGYEIIRVNGWDYPALVDAYERAGTIARKEHVPVIIHVVELTQPQGHSTSGSHERYKSPERLEWEREYDCNAKFREWILANGMATDEELQALEKDIKKEVREGKKAAWDTYLVPIASKQKEAVALLQPLAGASENRDAILELSNSLATNKTPMYRDVFAAVRTALRLSARDNVPAKTELQQWLTDISGEIQPKYSDYLYSESNAKAVSIVGVKPAYAENAPQVDGRVVLRDNFDKILEMHPEVLVFGEDSGQIGDVNQGLEGLQKKYGEERVADTGIREATILGQGIGLAMRGLRPIAEIQYLDYVLYALQIMSDDLATVHYRTAGKQKAPAIIRTRGHRLEGIWHSGSHMGALVHLLRGMHVLVPRDMTKAAGFYNTLLESDEPGLIVENLNGYRLKEKMPSNLGELRTPVGVVETIREGKDITLVSYGSTLRIVSAVASDLEKAGIDAEVIDVQSLLPFDLNHDIAKSVQKTNRLLVVDEDVPGGASAYIMQHVLDEQDAYRWLDSKPQTLTAKPHRPAYGTDGDYFSKPSAEDIFEAVYAIMHESDPAAFPE